jgi:hypothetical protein
MNKLQTVLDALPADKTEAIEIVKQMMQAEPVAKYLGECPEGSLVQLFDDVKKGADLYAAPQAAPAWLPIESAPKDETEVLLGHSDGSQIVSFWRTSTNPKRTGWVDADLEVIYWPTHWMPLPAAPKGAV